MNVTAIKSFGWNGVQYKRGTEMNPPSMLAKEWIRRGFAAAKQDEPEPPKPVEKPRGGRPRKGVSNAFAK